MRLLLNFAMTRLPFSPVACLLLDSDLVVNAEFVEREVRKGQGTMVCEVSGVEPERYAPVPKDLRASQLTLPGSLIRSQA
jgi:hypothetical protein